MMSKHSRVLWVVSFVGSLLINLASLITTVLFAYFLDTVGPEKLNPILQFFGALSFLIAYPYASIPHLPAMGVVFLVFVMAEAIVFQFIIVRLLKFFKSRSASSTRKS